MPNRELAITFAGGGNRAFYQLGLMRRWGPLLLPRVAAVAACSAGACVATFLLSERAEAAGEFWKQRRNGVTKNFDLSRLLRGERPAPHGPIYRDTLVFAFSDGGLERLRAQPFPILVLASQFPRRIPAAAAVAAGISTYWLEKAVRKSMVHPTLGKAIGFAPFVFDARACESPDDLADLIIASSATPPFTPIGRFRERALLDGGLVDNVPVFVAEAAPGVRRTIALLTRPYPAEVLGNRGSRLYIAPSEVVPVTRWDYTRPDLLEATIEMGEREADDKRRELDDFLEVEWSSSDRVGGPELSRLRAERQQPEH